MKLPLDMVSKHILLYLCLTDCFHIFTTACLLGNTEMFRNLRISNWDITPFSIIVSNINLLKSSDKGFLLIYDLPNLFALKLFICCLEVMITTTIIMLFNNYTCK